jgi:RNA polymerase sigma factor (sigma-70 family)
MVSETIPQPLLKAIDFHIDNTSAANEHFILWRKKGSSKSRDMVQVWVYCWTRRYFLRKFMEGSISTVGDAEKLIEEVFFTVHQKQATVKDPSLFASWVSVICKYRFLNYVRIKRPAKLDGYVMEEIGGEENTEENLLQDIDIKHFFEKIITDEMILLPDYVQAVLRKKIWEDKSYDEISKETGYSVETSRAYFARGLKMLRESPNLKKANAISDK